MKSQDRQHEGKRGAAMRKARRDGYHCASRPWKDEYRPVSRRSPYLFAAFIHGAHDWARKHGENRDGSYDKAAE